MNDTTEKKTLGQLLFEACLNYDNIQSDNAWAQLNPSTQERYLVIGERWNAAVLADLPPVAEQAPKTSRYTLCDIASLWNEVRNTHFSQIVNSWMHTRVEERPFFLALARAIIAAQPVPVAEQAGELSEEEVIAIWNRLRAEDDRGDDWTPWDQFSKDERRGYRLLFKLVLASRPSASPTIYETAKRAPTHDDANPAGDIIAWHSNYRLSGEQGWFIPTPKQVADDPKKYPYWIAWPPAPPVVSEEDKAMTEAEKVARKVYEAEGATAAYQAMFKAGKEFCQQKSK